MSKSSSKPARLPAVESTDEQIRKMFLMLQLCNINAPRDLQLLIAKRALDTRPAIKRNQARRAGSGNPLASRIKQPDANLAFISFSKKQERLDRISFSRKDVALSLHNRAPEDEVAYGEYKPCKNDVISRFMLAGLSYSDFRNEFLGVFIGRYLYNTPMRIIRETAPCFSESENNIWHRDDVFRDHIKPRFGLPADLEKIELRPASADEELLIGQCLETFLLPYPSHSLASCRGDLYAMYFTEQVPRSDPDLFYLSRNHLIACPRCYGWASLLKDAKQPPYTKIHVPTFVDGFRNPVGEATDFSLLSDPELGLIR